MTDVANYDHGQVPVQRPNNPSAAKADTVRKTLARIRSQFLAPFDAWEKAVAHGAAGRGQLAERPAFLTPQVPQPPHPATEEGRQGELARFDAALRGQPDPFGLEPLRTDLDAAANGQPSAAANRLIVATMVAAFPNVRPHSPETYLEALIEALDHTGLPPTAVAKTCNEVYSTSTFAPTVAEVLTKAKETHASLSFAVRQIDQYSELMAWAKKVRDWIATVPLLKEDRSNADRAPRPPASLTFHRSTAEWR
ncbi:hypothetical protein [Brevundimonas naejangsanensis]|uniref:hypothetical protein n=1 Tax=Brevundimonas naejangsanensis TaxID=588932 RepID=UPI0034D5F7C9